MVVEGPFAALERTVQFYLVNRGLANAEDVQSLVDPFEYGAQAGVFSQPTKDALIELWKCMHDPVPKLVGPAHDGIC